MKTQAALHDPDQIAGGGAGAITKLGSRRINSSIGSQWRKRIIILEKEISDLQLNRTEKKKVKMNVELIAEYV